MTKHPKIIDTNTLLLRGKKNPNLRRWCCFKVKQANVKNVIVTDAELCIVCIYILNYIKYYLILLY